MSLTFDSIGFMQMVYFYVVFLITDLLSFMNHYIMLSIKKIRHLFCLPLFSLLASCFTSKNTSGKISLNYKDFSEQPVSVVHIPVTVDLSRQLQEAEQNVAKTYSGKDEPCEGIRYAYNFNRMPFQFAGSGDKLNISFRGSYQMTMSYCAVCAFGRCVVPRITASCGINEPLRRLDIGYSTSFRLKPDYVLESSTALTKLEAIDPCNITFLQLDITDRLTGIVRNSLIEMGKEYDRETSAMNLKEPLQTAWDTLTVSTKLDDGLGYFSIKPRALGISPFVFEGSLLKFNAGLTVQPVLKPEYQTTVFSKLPNLSTYLPSNGFNVCTDVALDYDTLTQMVNRSYRGKKFMMKNRELVVEQISIKGMDNNRMVFLVDFSGSKKGTISISGHPYLIPDSLMAGLTDTKVHLAKSSFILKIGFRLFKNKIQRAVSDNATISLKDFTEESRVNVEKKLNQTFQQQYQLSGKVKQLKFSEVYASEKVLKIRTWTTGDISLFIR
jgi:hypothetical protein